MRFDWKFVSDEAVNHLRSITQQYKNIDKFALTTNFSPTRSVLFIGPVGVGKTCTAFELAYECSFKLANHIFCDEWIEQTKADTITHYDSLFNSLTKNKEFVVLNNFDVLGSDLTLASSFAHYLRQCNIRGMVVAISHQPELLPQVLIQEFDDVVKFGMPNDTQLREFYDTYIQYMPFREMESIDQPRNLSAEHKLTYNDIVHMVEAGTRQCIAANTWDEAFRYRNMDAIEKEQAALAKREF
jgi:hypothetical protein